jgi:hypothetical protein
MTDMSFTIIFMIPKIRQYPYFTIRKVCVTGIIMSDMPITGKLSQYDRSGQFSADTGSCFEKDESEDISSPHKDLQQARAVWPNMIIPPGFQGTFCLIKTKKVRDWLFTNMPR